MIENTRVDVLRLMCGRQRFEVSKYSLSCVSTELSWPLLMSTSHIKMVYPEAWALKDGVDLTMSGDREICYMDYEASNCLIKL